MHREHGAAGALKNFGEQNKRPGGVLEHVRRT
jgi:hypothetical protein